MWLDCDRVICHLHTLDICMVVRGCALLKKASKDAVTVACLGGIWYVSLDRSWVVLEMDWLDP